MADKARYYLEQSIPELKEFEKQKIFTKVFTPNEIPARHLLIGTQEEILAISKKRSEFEHKVNSPGCRPIDYVRYAE